MSASPSDPGPVETLMETARRPDAMARCYSTQEAADLLSVSYDTVNRLINDGTLRTILVYSKRRVPLSVLVAFVEHQLQPAGRRVRRSA